MSCDVAGCGSPSPVLRPLSPTSASPFLPFPFASSRNLSSAFLKKVTKKSSDQKAGLLGRRGDLFKLSLGVGLRGALSRSTPQRSKGRNEVTKPDPRVAPPKQSAGGCPKIDLKVSLVSGRSGSPLPGSSSLRASRSSISSCGMGEGGRAPFVPIRSEPLQNLKSSLSSPEQGHFCT